MKGLGKFTGIRGAWCTSNFRFRRKRIENKIANAKKMTGELEVPHANHMAQRILNKCAAGVLGEDNSDAEGNEISGGAENIQDRQYLKTGANADEIR